MRGLKTSDYDFALPLDRIAQTPMPRRDESRLMVVNRRAGTIAHHVFRDLPTFLSSGDAIVVNTTRVFKARLLGTRDSGAPAEVLLLKEEKRGMWEAMVQPGNKLKPGRIVTFAPGFRAEMGEPTDRGTRLVKLLVEGAKPGDRDAERAAIAATGHVPLPPYIERADAAADVERYQTVYAKQEGSVAAPTAGLHFTSEVLAALAARSVQREEVLLHVGAGTFKPVEVDDPAQHQMHEEWYDVAEETAARLTALRRAGGRVCAVGTTALRTLETLWTDDAGYRAGSGETRIFIRPPEPVRSADALVTNFHLPRSTLMMLVAAFAGYELTMDAYATAVREKYRFYSYGDAMLLL
ncbi:tRNA preQ1(34) S-adenosylmethionine ribosyltransferase-isomerase QueA [Pseudogemmatithrix spongiicola]|uniref:S-adenosylmethionine:tRNA ribosyltransferase-isomerase n=1 Tax=Pseudogemmatithrix spongiicola TaxID=3062599 RepID=A0AA49Q665_9BACT|nr:tRNA preQ1(34) S-adenosylmethionine ribosyltransferase-isomerase QueA [Gemmatimonadaceae bacterium 'strain 138']WKW14098.1 tRNA preQ1(34) S-adenosylmethionine ribosyltransferase-isomerase QueA [Gemmatimonadaceae bacterium 'strain 318']